MPEDNRGTASKRHLDMKRSCCLLLAALLLGACDGSSSVSPRPPEAAPSRTTATPQPARDPQIGTLSRDCSGWSSAPVRPEITFGSHGRLFSFDPATGDVLCLARRTGIEMEWGARGDRLLTRAPEKVAYTSGGLRRLPGDIRYETWSRPTGTSIIYVSHDFGRLLKQEVATGEVTDVSFLAQHLDVAYHPAGTHIAVAGETENGRVGVFLATNRGTQVQQIVSGHKAEQVGELGFSHDGRRLYFQAAHGDRLDLHAVELATGEEAGSMSESLVSHSLKTIFSGDKGPYYAVSPFSRRPRVLYGPCVPGEARIRMGAEEAALDPALGAIDPVGWLPDDTVVFLAYPGRCDDFGEGDLYSWKNGEATLLVENVDGAAVRARLPKAPDPPARAREVVA